MSGKIAVSIIIPTLNEEEDLPKILSDLERQEGAPKFETIVADGGSKDKTREIAKKFGARVVDGGNSPGIARNRGARIAKGDLLFFLDSDVRVPKKFVRNAYGEMQDRFIDLATCPFSPESSLKIDELIHDFANFYIRLNRTLDPHIPGFCLFSSKRLFERVGGFDETLRLSEDHDFAKRASLFRPIEFLDKTSIRVSIRRLRKEGRVGLSIKYFKAEVYRILNIKGKKVEYAFGEFKKAYGKSSSRKKSISQLADESLLKIEHLYRSLARK